MTNTANMPPPPGHPDDARLVANVVRNAGHGITTGEVPRWVAVKNAFVVGSTSAHYLCCRFGFDPDEMVGRGIECEPCEECRGCRCEDGGERCVIEDWCACEG